MARENIAEQYLDPDFAKRLNFNGHFVVVRAGKPLAQQVSAINELFLAQIPQLEPIITIPTPHMTLCWISDIEVRENILDSLENWLSINSPFRIYNASPLARFQTDPRLPYMGIKNTTGLISRRTRLTDMLSQRDIPYYEEKQPHLSLFYCEDSTTWRDIEPAVNQLRRNIRASQLSQTCQDIELVTFNQTGTQQITRLS